MNTKGAGKKATAQKKDEAAIKRQRLPKSSLAEEDEQDEQAEEQERGSAPATGKKKKAPDQSQTMKGQEPEEPQKGKRERESAEKKGDTVGLGKVDKTDHRRLNKACPMQPHQTSTSARSSTFTPPPFP